MSYTTNSNSFTVYSYKRNHELNQVKTLTKLFVNWELTIKQIRASLFNIDIDAVNLFDSFWYERFSYKWFISSYKEMMLKRILVQ